MKKVILSLALVLGSLSAQAASYQVVPFNGMQVDGCEVTMDRGYNESKFSFHVSNIHSYWVSADNKGLKIIFNILMPNNSIKEFIRVDKDKLDETLKVFRNIRNKCSFAPQNFN